MDLIEEAKNVAAAGGRACEGDIDLLVEVLNRLAPNPTVIKLGANLALSTAILAGRPDTLLWLIDDLITAQNWELQGLENYGFDMKRHRRQIGIAGRIAETYTGPKAALLVLDLSFSYEGVIADLEAWTKHLRQDEAFVFVHDFDGETAPEAYPAIAQACRDYFPDPYTMKDGWSAVWRLGTRPDVPPPAKPNAATKVPAPKRRRKAVK